MNKYTIKDNSPLPNIKQTVANLVHAFVFTKFDIRWGYNNVHIKKGDEWKAAFKTPYGVFEPTVMFFGLTNSPATFQTMMNHIFRLLIDKHTPLGTTIHVYMDNIIIGTSSTMKAHISAVHDVLDLLEEHDLYLKPAKCKFHTDSIDYLGVILEKGVTHMDPIKIWASKSGQCPPRLRMYDHFWVFVTFIAPSFVASPTLHDH